jgi:hypothetical protein
VFCAIHGIQRGNERIYETLFFTHVQSETPINPIRNRSCRTLPTGFTFQSLWEDNGSTPSEKSQI